jgi:hypothetical protein
MVHVLWRRPATSPTDAVNAEGAQFLSKYIVLSRRHRQRSSINRREPQYLYLTRALLLTDIYTRVNFLLTLIGSYIGSRSLQANQKAMPCQRGTITNPGLNSFDVPAQFECSRPVHTISNPN